MLDSGGEGVELEDCVEVWVRGWLVMGVFGGRLRGLWGAGAEAYGLIALFDIPMSELDGRT